MSILADRLKELREEKELMQKEVATILNISTSAYGFYEQDKRTPTPDVLSKLADYFDVSVDYLLGRSNSRRPGELFEGSGVIRKSIKEYNAKNGVEIKMPIQTIAAHLEDKNLTDKKVKLIKNYIDALFDDED